MLELRELAGQVQLDTQERMCVCVCVCWGGGGIEGREPIYYMLGIMHRQHRRQNWFRQDTVSTQERRKYTVWLGWPGAEGLRELAGWLAPNVSQARVTFIGRAGRAGCSTPRARRASLGLVDLARVKGTHRNFSIENR